MNALDGMKIVIEETREELNKLVLTGNFEQYYAVSQRMDALIEEYLDVLALTTA